MTPHQISPLFVVSAGPLRTAPGIQARREKDSRRIAAATIAGVVHKCGMAAQLKARFDRLHTDVSPPAHARRDRRPAG